MGKTLLGNAGSPVGSGRGANAGRGTGDRASSVRASLAGYGTGPTRRDLSSRKAASLAAFAGGLKPESRRGPTKMGGFPAVFQGAARRKPGSGFAAAVAAAPLTAGPLGQVMAHSP